MDTRMKTRRLLTKAAQGDIFMPNDHDYIHCLNCGGDAFLNIERVLCLYTSVVCLECGFRIEPAVSYLSLPELNACRRTNYDWEYNKEQGDYDPVSVVLKSGDLPPRKFSCFNDILKSATLGATSTELSLELVEG